jgi:RNA:NAD 2'-phosphotransferase (TPT1/KptA family)/inhibitor of KinA sporulation pathway (predicted exonuclease)
MPPVLLLVDLEATCWERSEHRADEMETIEIGALRIEPGSQQAREFQCFVRPVRHPLLSDFCRRLTSITQAEVDPAEPFPAAFARFLAWAGPLDSVLFASWGEYDARQFQRDCRVHGVAYPFERHWNVKRAVGRVRGRRPAGMAEVLAELGLTLDGTHHRGLDDARNIARILAHVFGDGLAQAVAEECARPARLDPARLSRFLALVLRHRAHDFGLAPDGEGFVALEELVGVVERHASPPASRADVLAALVDPANPRFELADERVRARYGHARASTPVAYAPLEPPDRLYHGTSPAALAHIRREGLRPGKRQYVHLARERAEAERVSVRRAQAPLVLTVRARAAHAAGVVFHSPDGVHWLARSIPAEFVAPD